MLGFVVKVIKKNINLPCIKLSCNLLHFIWENFFRDVYSVQLYLCDLRSLNICKMTGNQQNAAQSCNINVRSRDDQL